MKKLIAIIAAGCCIFASCNWGEDIKPAPENVEIKLSETVVTLELEESVTIKALDIKDGSEVEDVVWISLNESVPSVDGGTVTAVGAGTATVRAIAVRGGMTAECKVNVNGPLPPEDIDFGGEGDIEDFH